MNCTEVKEVLLDFLFGELQEDVQHSVADHLRQCSACREEVEHLQEAVGALRKLPEIDPAQRIVFLAPQHTQRQPAVGFLEKILPAWLWRWGFRAALAAGLVLLLVFGTQVQYGAGRLTVSIGRQSPLPSVGAETVSPQLISLLKQWRDENLYLTNQLISENEKRQRDLLMTSLDHLASQIQQQRMEDLQFVAENLLRIQKTNEYNFDRTNSLLQGLVQFAAATYQTGAKKGE